jgi:hypothetical protein
MHDAQCSQIKDKCGSLDRVRAGGVLIDRYVIDENVSDAHAHLVPLRAIIFETAQNHRIALDELNIVVVVMLSAHGYDVARNVRRRIPPRS